MLLPHLLRHPIRLLGDLRTSSLTFPKSKQDEGDWWEQPDAASDLVRGGRSVCSSYRLKSSLTLNSFAVSPHSSPGPDTCLSYPSFAPRSPAHLLHHPLPLSFSSFFVSIFHPRAPFGHRRHKLLHGIQMLLPGGGTTTTTTTSRLLLLLLSVCRLISNQPGSTS